MTIALPATPVTGRHRLDQAGPNYLLVTPPRHYRSTSHRLSRREVLQLRTNDLVRPHSRVAPRKPMWRRVGEFLLEWLLSSVEPDPRPLR